MSELANITGYDDASYVFSAEPPCPDDLVDCLTGNGTVYIIDDETAGARDAMVSIMVFVKAVVFAVGVMFALILLRNLYLRLFPSSRTVLNLNIGSTDPTQKPIDKEVRRRQLMKYFEEKNVRKIVERDDIKMEEAETDVDMSFATSCFDSEDSDEEQQRPKTDARDSDDAHDDDIETGSVCMSCADHRLLEIPSVRRRDANSADNDGGGGDDSSSCCSETRYVPITCAICLNSYEKGDEVVWSVNDHCKHAFHLNCVVDYLVTVKDGTTPCPVCRQPFTDGTYHKVEVEVDEPTSTPPPVAADSGIDSPSASVDGTETDLEAALDTDVEQPAELQPEASSVPVSPSS